MKEEQERQSEMDIFNIFLKIVIQYKNTNTRDKIRSWSRKGHEEPEEDPRKEQQEEP